MITEAHTRLAADSLSRLNDALIASGEPGSAPVFTEVYERDHQEAIYGRLTEHGVPIAREVRLRSWADNSYGRVDFLIHQGGGRPRAATSSPVQYKPEWASVDAAVDDLFYLGMWWPGDGTEHTPRALWYSTRTEEAAVRVMETFASWLDWAKAYTETGPHARWSRLVAAWNPTARTVHSARIGSAAHPVGWLHHFEVRGDGPTPAKQSMVADEWPEHWEL